MRFRWFFFVFGFIFSCVSSFGQASLARVVAESPRLFEAKYQPKGDSYLLVPMNFNEHQAERKEVWAEKLKDKEVLAVDLVYTDFPRGRNFERLNQNRLIRLRQLLPDLFKSDSIDWRYIGQNGCTTLEEAKEYFHGFAVYYKPMPRDTIPTDSVPEIHKPEPKTVEVNARVRPVAPENVNQMTVREMIKQNYVREDSLIYNILERNADWKNMAVVNDCTGSMYTYNVEVMSWFNLHEQHNPRTKWFTFFNDGDFTPDKKKRIGKTGGVYMVKAVEFEQAKGVMLQTMMSGGGDSPENDLEALLMTARACPSCEQIILIADASSPIRDLRLLKKYRRKYDIPVRVVLCGVERGIDPAYMTIAYQTNGSVHSLQRDLMNLSETPQEAEIRIAHHIFKLFDEAFVLFKREVETDFSLD